MSEPSIVTPGGNKYWLIELPSGLSGLHRLDGPAVIRKDGSTAWYYKGKKISCKSTEEFLKIIKLISFW